MYLHISYTYRITERFLQKTGEAKLGTTGELTREAGGADQGKANKGGTEFCVSLELRKERNVQLWGGKQCKVLIASMRSGILRII